MAHILKYTEWESISGWHTGDVSSLAKNSNAWWLPARMLQITPADFILLLKDKFHAYDFSYYKNSNLLLWHWKTYDDCHKFTLYINKEAKKRQFFIE